MTAQVAVYIDSCAWNALFRSNADLSQALPRSRYRLCITREVEIELQRLRERGHSPDLVRYINEAITANAVETTSVFGFAVHNPDGSLSQYQPYGGFDVGTWQSEADRRLLDALGMASPDVRHTTRKEPLGRNRGDASIALRSFDSVVLTNEARKKKGPLKKAAAMGGNIIYLHEVESSGMSLDLFIQKCLGRNYAEP